MEAVVRVANPTRGMFGAEVIGGSYMGDYVILELLGGSLNIDDVVQISELAGYGVPEDILNKTQLEKIEIVIVIQNFCGQHQVKQQCFLN